MDIFTQLAERIIKEQENIIGPIALERANNVPGMKVDWANRTVSLEGDRTEILEKLVESYRHFFGQASVEVCREAVKQIITGIPQDKIPAILQ
jgi:hypothetical protein